MDSTELIKFQLSHSAWALDQLIGHARTLTPQQLTQDLGIGPGSLIENFAHTIEAMFYYADNFAGRTYAEREGFAEAARSLDGLVRLHEQASRELAASVLTASASRSSQPVQWPNAESGHLPFTVAFTQVIDHATLHRTQCINMLKRHGLQPVPDLDPLAFYAAPSA